MHRHRARRIVATTAITLVVGHIFDDGERGHLELSEHLNPFDNVDVRQLMRSRDDDSPRKDEVLAKS